MKKIKFAFSMLSIVLLFSNFSAQSQTVRAANAISKEDYLPKKTLRIALRSYEHALRPELADELVTSGVFQSMRFKLAYPNLNYTKIVSALIRLSLQARTPELRRNAQIAACVMSNPDAYLNPAERTHLYSYTEETRAEFFAFLDAKVMATGTN